MLYKPANYQFMLKLLKSVFSLMVGAALASAALFIAPDLLFLALLWFALAADSNFVLKSGKWFSKDLNSWIK